MLMKHAVLGLLVANPRHGYAIRGAFEERLAEVGELNYSQVYQVLTDLERNGLVVGHRERIGKRPPRKVFEITPAGMEAFRQWLAAPPSASRAVRDGFYLRLLFLEEVGVDSLKGVLRQSVRHCTEQLSMLVDLRKANRGSELRSVPRRLITEAAILHAEADLKALELCRSTLEWLDPSGGRKAETLQTADAGALPKQPLARG